MEREVYWQSGTTICHEWIHMCQQILKPGECRGRLSVNEGMMEFELVVFQDVVHYIKYGNIHVMKPGEEFPEHSTWISSLALENKIQRDFIIKLYETWIYSTFKGRKIPEHIQGGSVYDALCQFFFEYNMSYKNRGFQINTDYGISSLESMLNEVAKKCYK